MVLRAVLSRSGTCSAIRLQPGRPRARPMTRFTSPGTAARAATCTPLDSSFWSADQPTPEHTAPRLSHSPVTRGARRSDQQPGGRTPDRGRISACLQHSRAARRTASARRTTVRGRSQRKRMPASRCEAGQSRSWAITPSTSNANHGQRTIGGCVWRARDRGFSVQAVPVRRGSGSSRDRLRHGPMS
jgi:hypothetical protein